MGMAAVFDPGRCQELCALLAEEFYRGDDAVPRSWLCATPWTQPSGTGPELRTRAVRGSGVLPALRTDDLGSRFAVCAGFGPPSLGGSLRQKLRLSSPLVPKNRGFPGRIMSCLPRRCSRRTGVLPAGQCPAFPCPCCRSHGIRRAHSSPAFLSPRRLGVGILLNQGAAVPGPAGPSRATGPGSVGLGSRLDGCRDTADRSCSFSVGSRGARTAAPARPIVAAGGSFQPRPVSRSRPVFFSFPVAPAQTAVAARAAPQHRLSGR